ncbi:MAG TPA: hypothetical protein P5205_08350 [Candidatus Paceibacterota bacterium]|nr:hypothetical protein [Verrucomicrobiota bacterium]HSA10368.1 hypothetical protein [Candidatus Paceibacterota bacterium]
MKITYKLINDLMTPRGAWTRDTLRKLGVKWPPKHGWKERIVGNEIPDTTFDTAPKLAEHFFEY